MKGSYAFRVLLKYLYELLSSKEGRRFLSVCWKCGDRKRYKADHVRINGTRFYYKDNLSFIWQYWEIYHKQYYRFDTDCKKPVIFDCGANIGLASSFFLRTYPGCELVVFEPDPSVAQVYLKNIPEAKVFHQKAVWINNKGVKMVQEGADAGFVSEEGELSVESISLKEELRNYSQVDMLKVDIEGAEHYVIDDCKEELFRVQNIFIEYHDLKGKDQALGKMLGILEETGFSYLVTNENHHLKTPFKKILEGLLQVNIFATRIKK